MGWPMGWLHSGRERRGGEGDGACLPPRGNLLTGRTKGCLQGTVEET